MAGNPFALLRLGIFGVILLFSLINLGLSANFASKASGWTFPGFALAVSILTMIIATPMLVIDLLRKGSFVSWVAIELGWCGLLWVLWLASAALSTSTVLFTGDCSVWIPSIETLCRQYSAIQAFSWLIWLLFTSYMIMVVVLAVLATVKGHTKAWISPASDLSFSPTHTASGEPKIPPVNYNNNQPNYGPPGGFAGAPGAYPPNQQQPYSPGPNYVSPQMTGATGYNQYASPQGAYGQPGGPAVAQV